MRVFAIVPAHNEAPRIGAVLEVLARHPSLDHVLVVDDGSTDDTAEVARSFGGRVEVLSLSPNRRKGGAMLAGLDYLTESEFIAYEHDVEEGLNPDDIVLFVDADLRGFTADHVRQLAEPLKDPQSPWAMVVGMRDYGPGWTEVTRHLPLISGERAVRANYLFSMPPEAFSGFGVEVALNDHVARSGGRIGTTVLEGLGIVLKWQKEPGKGVADMLKMSGEVTNAMVRARRAADPSPASLRGTAAGGSSTMVFSIANTSRFGIRGLESPVLAPPPASVEAECDSTECVTDALARSIIRAGGPFARDELWTPEVQERVGQVVGRHVSRPLWVSAACGSFYFFGPLGLCATGIAWLVSNVTVEAL
jgi:hypothetical protein